MARHCTRKRRHFSWGSYLVEFWPSVKLQNGYSDIENAGEASVPAVLASKKVFDVMWWFFFLFNGAIHFWQAVLLCKRAHTRARLSASYGKAATETSDDQT